MSVPRKRPTSRIYGDSKQPPVVQVPASPQNQSSGDANNRTSLYANLTSGERASQPLPPLSKFSSSNGHPRLFSSSPSPPAQATGRLASLSKFSYQPKTASQPAASSSSSPAQSSTQSTVFSRYADLLSRGDRPQPNALSAQEEKVFHQLKAVFPSSSDKTVNAAVKTYKTFDAAANWLSNQDQNVLTDNASTADSPESSPAKRQMTAKREVNRPQMSIREKFSAARRTEPEEVAAEAAGAAEPKRKLVKSRITAYEEEAVDDMDDSDASDYGDEVDYEFEGRVLNFLNTASVEDIADIAACSEEAAKAMVDSRPFSSLDQAREVQLDSTSSAASTPGPDGKPKARRRPKKPAGDKIVNDCSSTLHGYEAVDSLIQKCEELGNQVSSGIKAWGVNVLGSNDEVSITEVGEDEEEDEDIKTTGRGGYFKEKPKLLADDVTLKSYQQVGINWLSLLYNRGLSCILADEMGLGKTCQVVAFLARLKEIGSPGPHLVVVPASTLENWLREFQKFCPSFRVEPYYGSQMERAEIRESLSDGKFDVLVTTYNLACGSKPDAGFLKSFNFNVCVYDEGHMLKNSQSERYTKLMRLKAQFRLLLTGTPLQNNLRELVSLLSFILPSMFQDRKEELQGIFKHKAKATESNSEGGVSKNPLLSEQRINKAKAMMTPFILRRKKDQVLQHLPSKLHAIEYCDMTERQLTLYNEELETSRKNMETRAAGGRAQLINVMMQLRKAAIHPLLFRRLYTTEILREMAKEIMGEPVYKDANEQYIFEDMEVMSDYELHVLCEKFPDTIGHRALDPEHWMDSGKVKKLVQVLPDMHKDGDRILLFSQFTQVLDILERVLSQLNIAFLRMDGSTPVDIRQDMIDKFTNETDISVFLLSTKAGGFGINLACANVVIIHDLSFNPHDDKQAEDRAHRVGQTQEVNVIRLITKQSVEENILSLANTKLALDASVNDEKEAEKAEANNATLVAKMMFDVNSALPSAETSAAATPAET